MFKFKKVLPLVILLVGLIALPALAVKVATMGAPDSSGNYPIEVDHLRKITFPGGGVYAKYEAKITNDTLTVADSGTVFVVNPTTSPVIFTLPDADVGITYTFINSGQNIIAAGTGTAIILNPKITDYILYTNSAVTSGFAAGDSLRSGGLTGDSVTIVCTTNLYWDVYNVRGTWTDTGTLE